MKALLSILAFLFAFVGITEAFSAEAIMGAVGAYYTVTTVVSWVAPVANTSPFVTAGAVLYKRQWQEFISTLRSNAVWMNGLPDLSGKVFAGSEGIAKFIDFNIEGAAPNVLTNNTSYPIATAGRTDSGDAVTLNYYDTENTTIQKEELFGLPYDKPGTVAAQHRDTLQAHARKWGLHNIAPVTHAAATTPVLLTTGANDGTGRKRLTLNDLVALKLQLDLNLVPEEGRRLVLCPQHCADLLLQDQSFRDRYYNTATGKLVANLMGFEIYEDILAPYYTAATKTKKAFGATPSAGDYQGSVAFWTSDLCSAVGEAEMFARMAENDPEYRRNTLGFRLWHIIAPKGLLRRSQGAIVSDAV